MSASNTMTTTNAKQESPAIESLRVVDGGHRIIAVTWAAGRRRGRTDIVCLSPLIDTHKFYAPIRKNSEIFETVRVIDDGYALAWGNGSIDMSASSVERLAAEAMTGKDFCDFMKRNALTHQAAAAALGRSKRQIENYLQYETLPRMVVLACIGYEVRSRYECAARAMVQDHLFFEQGTVCMRYEGWPSGNNPYTWTLPVSPIAIKVTHHRGD
jgi:hypothetical protein